MRIVAPVATPDEVEPLAAAGADEFYCGLVPREWAARFGTSTLNRRRGGNLSSLEELGRVVETAHARERDVAVALNAQHYGADRWPHVLDLVQEVARLGADAAIVGDVGLLAALGERETGLRLHVSSVVSCHNTQAAALFRDLGASRIILPRHVTLAEIAEMTAALPAVEFEAFVLNDGCIFEEGSCHTIHLPPELGGPICMNGSRYDYSRTDGAEPSALESRLIADNEAAYASWTWFTFACDFTLTETGLPHGPCGFCAMPKLAAAGVSAVKIAGREGGFERRLRSVELVSAVMGRMTAGAPAETVAAFARGLRGKPGLCADGYMCYYRDAPAGAGAGQPGPGLVRGRRLEAANTRRERARPGR